MSALLTPGRLLEQRWKRQQRQQPCSQGSSRSPGPVVAAAATADPAAAAPHAALLELELITCSPAAVGERQQLLVGRRLLKRRWLQPDANEPGPHETQQQQQQQLVPPLHQYHQQQQHQRHKANRQHTPGQQRHRAHPHHQPEERGAVPLHSTPRTSMRPQEVMQLIRAAGSISQLAELHALHRPALDQLHLAALLNRLVHTRQQQLRALRATSGRQRQPPAGGVLPTPHGLLEQQQQQHERQQQKHGQPQLQAAQLEQQPEQQDQQQQSQPQQLELELQQCHESAVALLEQLLGDLLPLLPRCHSRQLSGCLWAIARFHKAAAGSSIMQQAAAAALARLLGQERPPAVACSAEQAAPAAAADVAAAASLPLLQHGTAADVAVTLWSLGRLTRALDVAILLPPGSLQQLEQTCCQHLQQLACVSASSSPSSSPSSGSSAGGFLMSCMFGFAHLGRPVPALWAALVSAAGFNFVSRLQSQQVVVIAWAAAKLGHYDSALFARLLWRAVVVRSALAPQGVALLLWAAGRAGHDADPRAVAQLLQVLKQPRQRGQLQGQHLANALQGLMQLGLLQQHADWVRSGLLQQVMLRLRQLQPVGVATVLRALLELQAAAAAATAGRGDKQQDVSSSSSRPSATAALLQQRQRQEQQQQQPRGQRTAVASQRSVAVAAAASRGDAGGVRPAASAAAAADRQLGLLLREMSRHISAQLPATQPGTLHRIICCLAGLGYYDPRLFTKAAAALAAAAGAAAAGPGGALPQCPQHLQQGPQQQQQQQAASVSGQSTFSTQQAMHLLCLYVRFRHPAPALWSQLLPQLVAVQQLLQPRQLVLLLSAARAGSAITTPGDAAVLQQLLQLLVAALQQQQELSLGELVQLAAAGTWLRAAAAADCAATAALLQQADRHLQRLLPRLVSVALSQPHLLPLQHLPHLLEATVQSLAAASASDTTAGDTGSPGEAATSSGWRLQPGGQQQRAAGGVGLRQLQWLADMAVERLGCWGAPALVVLLHCATAPQAFDAVVADAYAEELLGRLAGAPASTLAQLLQVLAAARCQAGGGYSHAQLAQAAARQLHGRLLLLPAAQLRGVQQSLLVLEQGESPLGRAVARLLASEEEGEEE